MEKLRGILFREAFDYDNLCRLMQDEVMANEVYWHNFYKERSEELKNEIKKLKGE
jgi:CTP:phosphocholine cytidylyltransferase-like protein